MKPVDDKEYLESVWKKTRVLEYEKKKHSQRNKQIQGMKAATIKRNAGRLLGSFIAVLVLIQISVNTNFGITMCISMLAISVVSYFEHSVFIDGSE